MVAKLKKLLAEVEANSTIAFRQVDSLVQLTKHDKAITGKLFDAILALHLVGQSNQSLQQEYINMLEKRVSRLEQKRIGTPRRGRP